MNTTDWFVFIQEEHYFDPKMLCRSIMAFKTIMDRVKAIIDRVKAKMDRSIMAFFKNNEDYLKIKKQFIKFQNSKINII